MPALTISGSHPREQLRDDLALLRAAGWDVGELSPGAASTLTIEEPATISVHFGAESSEPAPEGFALLEALGGGRLERALAESVKPGLTVDKVMIGFNWTLVRAGDLCGIARSPARGTEGARTIRPERGFAGVELRDLAQNLCSLDPLRRSLGLAAINAFWNRPDPPASVAKHLTSRGGLQSIAPPGEGALIIGGFRAALKRLPQARIIEREPKPGDIPASAAPAAFRTAKTLAITAQTLMNGSLEPILRQSQMVPLRLLLGPSCPVTPILFDHGINEAFGAVIKDAHAAEDFIAESGTMIMLDHIAENRTIRA